MSIRSVKSLSQSTPTIEGAGVRLRRAIGFGETGDLFQRGGPLLPRQPHVFAEIDRDVALMHRVRQGAGRMRAGGRRARDYTPTARLGDQST